RIVLVCARARARQLGVPVHLYKNNTDFHGASYGAHENYLMARSVPFETVISALIPFFVTRPIYAGAGKVGCEPRASDAAALFQLSQRADFLTETASVDTLHRRPIINTRDEPHADPRSYRRLHVICGDANMSPYATWLKAGTTSLVLGVLEQGWHPPFSVRHPVQAMRNVSRDQSFRWLVETEPGGCVPAVEIQRWYLQAAQRLNAAAHPDYQSVLGEWERVLDALERDPFSLADSLDWVAKRQLLDTYRQENRLGWDDPALCSLDLEYHNIDPDVGLYYALEADGCMRPFLSHDEVARAKEAPPATRAAIRGACVKKFSQLIDAVTWTRVALDTGAGRVTLNLRHLLDGRAAQVAAALHQASTPADLAKMLKESV
ncbi:MAG: proteasome accessory factor PafA2 family protein, partial [Armatimonadota bacterium]|nr:proteasome accessory factor PafA2 family protein [Armatimonadota bacterium]